MLQVDLEGILLRLGVRSLKIQHKISIVAPVHNESENLELFYRRLVQTFEEISYDFELIFVDDGSTDGSFGEIERIANLDSRVRGMKLSRNFGHQNAVTCGLHKATGSAVVIIDTDLQDPPELIVELLQQWQAGYKNVYALRKSRAGESVFKKLTANLYYKILAFLSDYPIPVNTGDFRLIDKQLLENLVGMREENRFLRGMVAWLGFPTIAVPYDRQPRNKGKTSYTLRRMIKFATTGIFSFSAKPLKVSTYAGFIGILISFLFSVYVFLQKLASPSASIPGYTTTIVVICFFSSLQMISIGLLGEYLQRIYIEIKRRPLYVIEIEI